jgi:tetratricopeptide (TPR) repeat protein
VQIGQNANILGLLGICYANMKDYRQAVQYFDKALKIDPAQYEARLYQPRVKSLLKQ